MDPSHADDEPRIPVPTGPPPHALVAGDDPDVRALVARCLTGAGYEVVAVADGAAALAHALARTPDLVVLDVRLPAMSGLEVLRRLRVEAATRETAAVLLTARVGEDEIAPGFDAGATAYCRKPVSPRELTEVVARLGEERALRGRERERAAGEAALRRVATAIAASLAPRVVFSIVAEEAARLLGGDVGRVCRFEADEVVVVGLWGRPAPARIRRLPLAGSRLAARVAATGRAARVEDYDALRAGEPEHAALIPSDHRSGVAAPVRVEGDLWGTIMVVSTTRAGAFGAADERRLEGFADLVAMAIADADHHERLARLAGTDHLTGLPNRRVFDSRLAQALAWARDRGRPVSVVVFDLDHFTRVNDTHGRDVGDAVLMEAARRLAGTVREGELIARIGGEEFGWILPDLDEEGAFQAAERARRALSSDPFPVAGALGVSAGVSQRTGDEDAAVLVRHAGAALHEAKTAGRGMSVRWSDLSRGGPPAA